MWPEKLSSLWAVKLTMLALSVLLPEALLQAFSVTLTQGGPGIRWEVLEFLPAPGVEEIICGCSDGIPSGPTWPY